jgi:hypothetical protein
MSDLSPLSVVKQGLYVLGASPAAREALNCIGPKGAAAKRVGELQLALSRKVHSGNGENADDEPR